MGLSKKHFKQIAFLLKNMKSKEILAEELCDFFEAENPRFNREKFLKACNRQ